MLELAERLIDSGFTRPYLALSFVTTSLKDVYESDGVTPAINRTVDISEYIYNTLADIDSRVKFPFDGEEIVLTSTILGLDPEVSIDPSFHDIIAPDLYLINYELSGLTLEETFGALAEHPVFYLVKLCDVIYDLTILPDPEYRDYVARILPSIEAYGRALKGALYDDFENSDGTPLMELSHVINENISILKEKVYG